MKTQNQIEALSKAQSEYDNAREAFARGTIDRNCMEFYQKRLFNAKFNPKKEQAIMNIEVNEKLAAALNNYQQKKDVYDSTGYKCHRWDFEEAEIELLEAQREWLQEFNRVKASQV